MTSTQPADLLVTGQILVDGSPRRGHVAITGSTISAVDTDVDPAQELPPHTRHLDVGDHLVLPGAIDAHVHSYSHQGEGLVASTSAAAAGGVTTIVEMPFDGAGPIGSRDRLLAKQDLLADEALVDVALLGTLLPEGGWRAAEELVDGGVVGFKGSLFDTDPFRFPRTTDAELIDVMRTIREVGSTLCLHAENNEIIKARLADPDNQASTDPDVHARTRPPVAETLGVLTAMEVAATEGATLHLCHLSLARSAELLRWYQSQDADVTFESCPHYLTFTEEDMREARGRLKINPPLRSASDQDAMWSALSSGLASVVASDHAPWPAEKKDHERILDNASGVPGVQVLVPAVLGGALRRYGFGAELGRVVDALTLGPARRYGLDHRKGTLAVGKDADLTIVAQDDSWQVASAAQFSNAGWTPYEGCSLGARVTTTISRGTVVWTENDGLVGTPGRGEQIRRS